MIIHIKSEGKIYIYFASVYKNDSASLIWHALQQQKRFY